MSSTKLDPDLDPGKFLGASPSVEEARGGCRVLEEEEPGLVPVVLVPQEATGEERSCGLLEDREPGGNSLVPIPQEPQGEEVE